MAGYGPPPANDKRRRNVDTFEADALELPADAAEDVDTPRLPGASKFLQATRTWYDAWCKSPQAAAFVDTDWTRLHMLAPLVDEFWRSPDTKLLAEIRLNETLLGATHVDRMRARIKVGPATAATTSTTTAPTADNVTPIGDRRTRLLADG